MLEGTNKSAIVKHEIKYKKNKSSHVAETDIALVKNEIKYKKDKSSHKAETGIALAKDVEGYDWVFATNVFLRDARKYVGLYRKRWNIETMFRVHDEARIKSKSVNPLIRLFYFMVSMLLLFIWNLSFKEKYTFKKFVINLEQMLKNIDSSWPC